MASLQDTDITDWDIANASNQPTDGTYIGGNLAGQFRNIKSVARAESLTKQFQKTGLTTASATSGSPATIVLASTAGDQTGTFTAKRKVRLRPSDGSTSFVYVAVLLASYDIPTTTTTFTAVNLYGSVLTGGTYFVDVGVEQPTKSPMPLFIQSGTVTAVDGNTSVAVTFPIREMDSAYFAKFTVISSDSANPGASIIDSVAKSSAGTTMTATLNTSPGAGKTVVFGWTIMRES